MDMPEVAIIGAGTMGRYMMRALAPKARITVYYRNPRDEIIRAVRETGARVAGRYADAVRSADVVVFCVPTGAVIDVMAQTLPYCKKGAIISGESSRKAPEAYSYDRHVKENSVDNPEEELPGIFIHTLCDPEKSDPTKEILGIVRHRASDEAYEKARSLFDLSSHIEEFSSVEDHDITMMNTQRIPSLTFLTIASAFANVGCFPWRNKAYASMLDEIKFASAMRVASQPPHVYKGIQFVTEYEKELELSRCGRKIVEDALRIETELYGLIVSNERSAYRDRVMAAREKIFGSDYLEPIIPHDIMKGLFENMSNAHEPNSNISYIPWVVSLAESGRNPFVDLRGATPMFTTLLCTSDYLFNDENLLEESLAAPFDTPKLRRDDLVFHNELLGWSFNILLDSTSGYDAQHARMKNVLDRKENACMVKEYVGKSVDIVRTSRECMDIAIKTGKRKAA